MNGQEPMDRRRCRTHKPLPSPQTHRPPSTRPSPDPPSSDETRRRDVRIGQQRAHVKILNTRYGDRGCRVYVWPWNGMVLLLQACWICPMHGCTVFAHTHALTQHIKVTYIASPIPSLSAPVFRPRPTDSSPSRATPSQQDLCFT